MPDSPAIRCDTKPDGSVSLPVVTLPERRKTAKNGRRRAGVLVAVHLLIIAHIVQWLVTGETVSPIEPSETMQTLEQGLLNAGAIFFALAILSTVLFGRYVCGWLCHVVALQDFCHWLMGRFGIRPKPFRARLLMLAPLALGLYMFVWPSLKRHALQPAAAALNLDWPWWLRRTDPFPGIQSELVVDDFWATFPEWYIAVPFLLVCGFATVYFLGAKAFCTYACPYGGIFALAEPASPTRVRVDHDKCHECGLCTAACTSNVRVHEEIKHFGMVVDAGCMKTMDCLDACPNDALSIGLGRPAIAAPVRKEARDAHAESKKKAARRWDLTWPQEIAFALVFLFLFIATRGMFDRVPMLMAGGLAAVGTGLTVLLWKTLTTPNARVHRLLLRHKGSMKPAGVAFIAVMLAGWAAAAWGFTGNTARWRAESLHAGIGIPVDALLRPEFAPSETAENRARASLAWFRSAGPIGSGGLGWALTPDDRVRIAYLHAVLGEYELAVENLEWVIEHGNPTDELVFQALALHASGARLASDAASDMAIRGQIVARANERYLALLKDSIEAHPSLHNARLRLAQELWNRRTYDPAIWEVDDPDVSGDPKFILNSGQLKALAGDMDGMSDTLDRVLAMEPDAPEILLEASQLARSIGRTDDADRLLNAGTEAAHTAPELIAAANIRLATGEIDRARALLSEARERPGAPLPGIRFQIGQLLYSLGDTDEGLGLMRGAAEDLGHAPWQRLGALQALAGLAGSTGNQTLLDEATEGFRDLVAAHPDEPIFHHDLSGLLYAIDLEAATRHIEEAATLGERNAVLAQRAAQANTQLGRQDEAERWIAIATERIAAAGAGRVDPPPAP